MTLTLSQWHQRAVENDLLIDKLRRELAEALAAREALFSVVVEEVQESAHEATA
jgi:hypothetical protein